MLAVQASSFGSTADGRTVTCYTLSNSGGMRVGIIICGGFCPETQSDLDSVNRPNSLAPFIKWMNTITRKQYIDSPVIPAKSLSDTSVVSRSFLRNSTTDSLPFSLLLEK